MSLCLIPEIQMICHEKISCEENMQVFSTFGFLFVFLSF